MAINLEDYIASIRDFPIEGILFRDVTPILTNPEAYKESVRLIAEYGKKVNADLVVGPESRGFWFGCPVALELGVGFAPVRKPGKLPRETISCKYDLEYGSNEVHMHKDAVKPGQRVLIVDDLLATGGTAKATAKMIEELGGVVAGIAFVVELYGNGMEGRQVLEDYDVYNILKLSDQ
jgi:adenine phosphoribosyltransferase